MNTTPETPRPILWPVDRAASTAGTYHLRTLEQARVAAPSRRANDEDRECCEQGDRPDDDQRVEQPRQLADEEIACITQGAVQASRVMRHRRHLLRRDERHRNSGKRPLAHGARARLRLLCERLLRLVELVAQAQTLLRRERACELALEADDLRAQLQDVVLQDVRLPLQVLDAYALRGDLPELAEAEHGVLDLGDRNAKDERCRAALSRRVHVDGGDVAAVAACDLHRACGRLGKTVAVDAHAQPRAVFVEARRRGRQRPGLKLRGELLPKNPSMRAEDRRASCRRPAYGRTLYLSLEGHRLRLLRPAGKHAVECGGADAERDDGRRG